MNFQPSYIRCWSKAAFCDDEHIAKTGAALLC